MVESEGEQVVIVDSVVEQKVVTLDIRGGEGPDEKMKVTNNDKGERVVCVQARSEGQKGSVGA